MQFEEQISSSGEPYYIDTITGETQWGSENFFNTKVPLPKGYICLFLNGKDVYKYIGEDEDLNSYSYSPEDFDKTSISATYKQLKSLKTQEAINERFRRSELFENVAILLKRTPESIIDESLEFLAGKADVLPQTIIEYIQTTELEELGENANVTAFSMISETDPSFSSERSIRELCGLNMREEELSRALEQLKDLNCGISLELIHEPVMTGCSNGHTCDKKSMEDLLKTSIRRCPSCNVPIPLTVTTLMPNAFAKKIIEEFVDKYINQRGEIWNKIKEICTEYKHAKIIRQKEKDLLASEREAERALLARVRESERARLERREATETDRERAVERDVRQDFERRLARGRESERARLERRESERAVERAVEREAERRLARQAREAESARLAREAGLERNVETPDRLAREAFEIARVAREAERVRLREAAHIAREAERVRLRLERETAERVRIEAERASVEAETARLETEIQGFRYRERNNRRR